MEPREKPGEKPGLSEFYLQSWLEKVSTETRGSEFASFRLACHAVGFSSEATKTAWARSLRRELGMRLEAAWPKRRFEVEKPEIEILLDCDQGRVKLWHRPISVRGRYRKLCRELSQTVFHCRRCRGRGCATCRQTGRLVEKSVEEAISKPLLHASGARAAKFHGMGREDIDVRMLGDGRPFIVELLDPRRRTLELSRLLADTGGDVEITEASFCEHRDIASLKAATPDKTYLAVIQTGAPVDEPLLRRAEKELCGRELLQRNPSRVPRRADLVRRRQVRHASLFEVEGSLKLRLRTQSGTYIKELISGDGGRTRPSLSELLGVPCRCVLLDVLAIHDRED